MMIVLGACGERPQDWPSFNKVAGSDTRMSGPHGRPNHFIPRNFLLLPVTLNLHFSFAIRAPSMAAPFLNVRDLSGNY
jgi:hypothetical protein